MARRNASVFQTIMPMLKKEKVGAINWGFVSGKTNTIFAWDTPSKCKGTLSLVSRHPATGWYPL
jgi:hypothetical protein